MPNKSKKIQLIFIIYWFLLAYIIAALVWWYIALSTQNEQMTEYRLQQLQKDNTAYAGQYAKIQDENKRKKAQYLGEGSIFFLLISAGAIFVYRSVNRQLKISQQQQNFMMAVTHELKTPIAVTRLNLETLQKRKLDEQQQQKLLHNTLEEADRMNALCNNMLLSSQIEAGGYRITEEELNLGELVQGCAADFINRFPQKPIHTSIEENIYVLGDKLLLQMVVNNLIDNAIKYSPKESSLSIMLSSEHNHALIAVKDEGPGIDESEKKKVFEKFYRTGNDATRRAKGTGLGLYLVNRIVSVHHGSIIIRNNQPKGAIFVVEIKQVV